MSLEYILFWDILFDRTSFFFSYRLVGDVDMYTQYPQQWIGDINAYSYSIQQGIGYINAYSYSIYIYI